MSCRFRAAMFSLLLAACGGGGDNGTAPNPNPNSGGSNTISVTNNAFSPTSKTVAVNSTVQWDWSNCPTGGNYGEDVCPGHTVTFDDGVDSGIKNSGTFSRTFSKAGSYPYHCQTHGAAMSGTITVQ